ncbi:Poly(3-hydroxyalkanoate) polymerase [Candidatus Filomicrobium marinum]|uniref:Poly(3-hydroxyalkanoate) polymerase n=1 Tax=Candidatus Filomicrobium marinum TaxID=1608628 RepID=A0A0D6JFG2_9HYPH|nr:MULTISPECIES: alpha/beta fold hydrolase [Filomicrobium]CFX21486.1 Poly(3-hydroxyalkanoate) polymerase [Candidatus Filomicrobium marinum]CPR18784.1 Poly(3-hydroxyalkanoate) polymerase [Candidatus Filomicrobium marinum]
MGAPVPRESDVADLSVDAQLPKDMSAKDRRQGGLVAYPASESVVESRTAQEQESVFRLADRQFHAAWAPLTFGLSPISLAGAWWDWALHLATLPGKQYELQVRAVENWSKLFHYAWECTCQGQGATPCVCPPPQDRRFQHRGWQVFPFNMLHQSFLLGQDWWHDATTSVHGVTARHERLVEFYSRQFLDMMSPANFVATNPEIIEQTVKEHGANFMRGLGHATEDIGRSVSGQRPAGAEDFEVGKRVAVTPGEVIFRNELIELIQYKPKTEKVRPEPILIIPAWIMKYYILDLSPHNSLIRYLVAQGFTVFCISWRNPGPELRDMSMDDYRRLGVMAALDVVETVTGREKVHAVGYCLGGTLLSIAASAMARDGDARLASLSFFAAEVDFEEPGELGLFIDEGQVSFIEDMMWQSGYLDQRYMAGAFQMLRSQDLIWSRMVHEYLMGDRPDMTDLMAWNADATRMPYRMQSDYLRKLFLGNDLAQGRFRVDGRPIQLECIEVPVFAVGTTTDHVAPWHSVFKLVHLLDVEVDFVLTSGGHNAGIVSEIGHPRRSYQVLRHPRATPSPDPDAWAASAPRKPGSWWPEWTAWLSDISGKPTTPPPLGRVPYKPMYPAPGTYVLER